MQRAEHAFRHNACQASHCCADADQHRQICRHQLRCAQYSAGRQYLPDIVRDRPGDGGSRNPPDLSLPDSNPGGKARSAGDSDQDDIPEALPFRMRVLDQERCFRRRSHQPGSQRAAVRFFPDQQHHQQAQDSAGKAVQDGRQRSEQESGQQHLGQHQEHGAVPVHQVNRVQQHSVGQPQLDAGSRAAQQRRQRDRPVQQAQDKRKSCQQSEARHPLCRCVHRRSLLSFIYHTTSFSF